MPELLIRNDRLPFDAAPDATGLSGEQAARGAGKPHAGREPGAGPGLLDRLVDRYAGGQPAPLPGSGRTLERWRLLAHVARQEGAAAVKLFESHLDALAICAGIAGVTPDTATRWAVWAAEPPFAVVKARAPEPAEAGGRAPSFPFAGQNWPGERVMLDGRKAWCSGAAQVSHALVTCVDEAGQRRIAVVDVRGPGVKVTGEGWHAVGMADTASGDVLLAGCPALLLGGAGAYLERPGFWHGGAGIAACWYGAVLPFADAMHDQLARREDPHAAAAFGEAAGELRAANALLREGAAWIDAHPADDAYAMAMLLRTQVERAVLTVLRCAGNALGAGPLCRDARLAALYADLPVFLRQSHAQRDAAALGMALARQHEPEWLP